MKEIFILFLLNFGTLSNLSSEQRASYKYGLKLIDSMIVGKEVHTILASTN